MRVVGGRVYVTHPKHDASLSAIDTGFIAPVHHRIGGLKLKEPVDIPNMCD